MKLLLVAPNTSINLDAAFYINHCNCIDGSQSIIFGFTYNLPCCDDEEYDGISIDGDTLEVNSEFVKFDVVANYVDSRSL